VPQLRFKLAIFNINTNKYIGKHLKSKSIIAIASEPVYQEYYHFVLLYWNKTLNKSDAFTN